MTCCASLCFVLFRNYNPTLMFKHYQRGKHWRMLLCTWILFSGLAFANPLQAQTVTVQGTVTDASGTAIPGVSVIEKGTTNGTVTNSEGAFRISVASTESILTFGFVGMVTQEVQVGNQSNIAIQLKEDVQSLSEVIVVGYGTQEKKDVTGSMASIKSDNFNKGVIGSPEQLLQGKVAGVNVTSANGEPGAAQSITIRGVGSVRQGSTPLFVVDGVALDNSATGAVNPLSFINPGDIESIDVLKDASATAIYGSRGANGVILITTKKGKAGVSSATYSTDFGVSTMAGKIPMFTADEFRKNVVAIGGELTDLGGSTDWQEEITRTAYTQNHNLALSGGSQNLTYYASLGLQDQEGVLKNSALKRYTGRVNVTQKLLSDRLTIDINLNASHTLTERPDIIGLVGTALSLNPTYPAYDANGKPSIFGDAINPLTRLNIYDDQIGTTRIIGNISPSFEIIKGLVFKMNLGVDHVRSERDIQQIPSTEPLQVGRLDSYYNSNNNKLIENYLTYDFSIDDHRLSLLAGHSYQNFFIQGRNWAIGGSPDNGIEPKYDPGDGTLLDLINYRPGGFATRNELQSFFGRVNYSFNSKYLVTATLRVDGSSKFGANNKYGSFPSFALGWRLTEEDFLKGSSLFSDLKVRAGWGQTGNQEIPSKITKAFYTSTVSSATSYPLAETGAYPPGTTYIRFANPNIQWEVSTQTNIGLDFGLFQGRLTGSTDYFHKVSGKILMEVVPGDPIQPAETYWTNVKDMTITNKGLEITLDYRHEATNGFSYGLGGNITFIDNVVENSPYTLITTGVAQGSGLSSATINGYMNGQPIGTFYMKEFLGINEDGESIYRDAVADGQDNDLDRVVAGSALPKTLYNFYGSVGYKRFDLSVNFNGVSGNKIYDNTANTSFYRARLAKSVNTTAAAMEFPNENNTNSASVSTRYLKDGAFLRLNNLSLAYTFNTMDLGIGQWIKALRVSITGQNLLLITKYDGYDPEVNTDRSSAGITSYGIDYMNYPKARTFMAGLNVTF